MTPFYERNGITIYCGDCAQVMSQWQAELVDLTVTSPPYDEMDAELNLIPGGLRTYNGYHLNFGDLAGQLWRVTTRGGVVVWVVGDATVDGSETGTSFRQALHFMGLGFRLHDTMIYQTDKPPLNSNRYEPNFEFMFVFSKNRPKTVNLITERTKRPGHIRDTYNRSPDGQLKIKTIPYRTGNEKVKENIWYFYSGRDEGDKLASNHPAIFPEALARDHIISWSNPGDLVCDPMVGSGTVAKMAQQLGRRFVGCDISEEYCRICVERLRQPSFFSLPAEPVVQPKVEQAGLW